MKKLPSDNITEIITNIIEENNILLDIYFYKITNDSINLWKEVLEFRKLNFIK